MAVVRRTIIVVVAAVIVSVSGSAVKTRMSVQSLTEQRTFGALQVGSGGSGGCGGGRMSQVQTGVIGVIGNSGQSGQRNGHSGHSWAHAGQETGFAVQQSALIGSGSGGCCVKGGERHGRRHGHVQGRSHASGHT